MELEDILNFLIKVDKTFPIPLSQKQNLNQYAEKLYSKATLCTECDGNKIIALVAGYTENVIDNTAYISVVATLPEYYGQGKASKLVRNFIDICRQKTLNAVHLYTVPDNISAVTLYQKIGFEKYEVTNETRPNDLHLIYYIQN